MLRNLCVSCNIVTRLLDHNQKSQNSNSKYVSVEIQLHFEIKNYDAFHFLILILIQIWEVWV